MVTLKQIADRAKVSIKTVSRVINREPDVAAETRDAVLKIAGDLGYVPNEVARSMRMATTTVIGMLTDVVVTTPYAFDIVGGAEAAMRAEGRTLLIGNTGGSPAAEIEYWRMFRGYRAAGALFATMFHREVDLADAEFGRPVVLVNCFDRNGRHPSVVPDDERGGRTQADHLIALGHRRIAGVTLNPVITAAGLRMAGIRASLNAAGLGGEPQDFLPGVEGPIGAERLVAYEKALTLLTRTPRPTAIICGHDQIASQVAQAALSLGLRIPEDLSIIGFDDQRLITEALRPVLTTVALPHYELGRCGSRMLLNLVAGMPLPDSQQRIDCPLIERGSCAPPARS